MNAPLLNCLAVLMSYALGSIPTGFWLGLRFRGVDIRQEGSGNIGATNTMRVLGKKLGAVTLLCDLVKGLVPVMLFSQVGSWGELPMACGVAAILGHSFSVLLKFRGGKGVATSAGVFLGLALYPTLIAAVAFALVFAATRLVSAASVIAALTLSAASFLFPLSTPVRGAAVLIALLVIVKHRGNIRRIFRGEEDKI